MTEEAAGTVEGVGLPPAGTWEIDPKHTSVEFVARHVLTKVRGSFTSFSGTLHVAERPEDSWAEVEIEAASVDTRTPDRDTHLRSPDFLDAEGFPKLTFRSTAVRQTGDNRFELVGDLTIKDITREVTLDCELIGTSDDPWGNRLVSFSARAEIDREDFGITWNVLIESGGWLVGRRVQIELGVEAVGMKPEA